MEALASTGSTSTGVTRVGAPGLRSSTGESDPSGGQGRLSGLGNGSSSGFAVGCCGCSFVDEGEGRPGRGQGSAGPGHTGALGTGDAGSQ